MKKFLRRLFKITGFTVLGLLLLVILIPVIFGDQIKTAVKDYINEEINATVYFEDIGISVFNNFPNLTVTLDEFGVVNKEPFEGDTLLDVRHFGVVVDLFSVFGDKYKVNSIVLDKPEIHVKVDKAGNANYDIVEASEEEETPEVEEEPADTSSSGGLALQLSSYKISEGHIVYDDRAGDMYAEIVNLNHEGSGDFRDDNFDFDTYTKADEVTFEMEGSSYMSKTTIDADLTVNIDNGTSVYTLKDNRIGINALNLHFDGFVAMSGDDINMDMTFGTNENKFSQILSMVPGMYTEDFDDIETDGTFQLDGKVKGKYNENQIPGFNVHLGVEKGHFHYPDLPDEVNDINFDVKVDCPDGDLNKLAVNMPKFHAMFGKSPIDARCVLSGLMSESYNIDAAVKTSVDLANIMTMFPMEGHELRGQFSIDGTAKGVYNEASGKMPAVTAIMKLTEGYYKTEEFPSAISNMRMDAEMHSEGQDLATGSLTVKEFHGEIDGDPIDATLKVNDFDKVNYDLQAKGKLSLDKLGKILEMEDTKMAGTMNLDLDTKGNLPAIEEERYGDLPTSGSMQLKDFFFSSPDLPQGLTITNGDVTFDPRELKINTFNGKVGSSPIALTGHIDNYLMYAMLPDQELTGTMTLTSSRFNVNEWMVEEPSDAPAPEAAEAPEEEVEMEAFEVPKGIDFVFNCTIGRVIYDNLNLDDMRGRVIMRDQKVSFESLTFNTLGGKMAMNGSYATPDPASPDVDLNFKLTGLDIGQTYKTIEMVKDFAPIAKFVTGKLNSSLRLNGKLNTDMTPDLASITSVGDMNVLNGKLSGFKAMDMVANKIKLNQLKDLKLQNIKALYEVHDGRIWVEPFDVPIGNGKMVSEGSHGLDQSLSYNLNFDVPAGAAGTAAMQAVGGLIKQDLGDRLKVNVGLGGTVDNPKIAYVKTEKGQGAQDLIEDKVEEVKEEVKEQIEEKKEEIKEQVEEKIDDAKEKARAEADKIIKDAEAQAAKVRAEAKKQAQKLRDEANKQADDIEKSAKNPIERAAKKKLAKKTRDSGEKAAKKVESEADVKANKIVDDAKKRADALLK